MACASPGAVVCAPAGGASVVPMSMTADSEAATDDRSILMIAPLAWGPQATGRETDTFSRAPNRKGVGQWSNGGSLVSGSPPPVRLRRKHPPHHLLRDLALRQHDVIGSCLAQRLDRGLLVGAADDADRRIGGARALDQVDA